MWLAQQDKEEEASHSVAGLDSMGGEPAFWLTEGEILKLPPGHWEEGRLQSVAKRGNPWGAQGFWRLSSPKIRPQVEGPERETDVGSGEGDRRGRRHPKAGAGTMGRRQVPLQRQGPLVREENCCRDKLTCISTGTPWPQLKKQCWTRPQLSLSRI